MKKTILILLAFLIILPTGCSTKKNVDRIFPQEHYTSFVSADDCFLCGADNHEHYWGKNNVGIISLNTFEVVPIEINRYNSKGDIIQENTGTYTLRPIYSGDNGFEGYYMAETDYGYASASILFYGDETLDVEKTANFLCEECLNQLTGEIYKNEFGVGVINFSTKEIRVFEEDITGFRSGDFYIHCDFEDYDKRTGTRNLRTLIFYCPLRSERGA